MDKITIIIIVLIAFQVASFISTWKLFKLAGQESWKAVIPVYSQLTILKIIERPWWWILFVFLPVIGPVMLLIIYADFIRVFGKRGLGDIFLTLFLGFFYIAYINYNKDTKHIGAEKKVETFIASIMFAVILATTIHTFVVQPMVIPTGSMENTLRIGDALFVEKLSYGSRIPHTPVSIPFSDMFYRKAYLKQIQLPYMRLPGWRELDRNDIVVFNYPTDSVHIPVDRKDPYVKRLVGMPGDTIEIKDGVLWNNGKVFQIKKDATVQFTYLIQSKIPLSEKYLNQEFELVNSNYRLLGKSPDGLINYMFSELSDNHVLKLRENPNIISVKKEIQKAGFRYDNSFQPNTMKGVLSESDSANLLFPLDKDWNRDNYGPLYIPKKGDKIVLRKENLAQFFDLINHYENNNVQIKNEKIYVDGLEKLSHEYTVQQDYFFMMGDNRHNSLDARFFGYVPEENLIGRPIFLWANLNQLLGFEKRHGWKWNRWFTIPNNGEPNKTSYIIYGLIFLGAYFTYDFIRVRKKKKKK